MATVTLRYWAAMRAAAGTAREDVEADTLAEALHQARSARGDRSRYAAVLAICSIVVDETPVNARDHADVVLRDGSVIELLPPFAGGA
ncbi:MAG TPA: MoaD/ThiS family protein [Jiangellaceae bacterium]